MKKIAVLALAAASLCATSSAFAQVSIGVPGGPGVTIGDGYRGDYRDRDFRGSRNEYRDDYRSERRYRRDRDHDRRDRVYIERD